MNNPSLQKVVTRIAPSPTGRFHIGTARTALFNFLYAKKMNGSFLTRIEDTDRERCKKEYEDDILENMEWLGLSYDQLERQSERTEVYTEKLTEIIDTGAAYVSKEMAKDGSGREVKVVRLRNPGKTITFTDVVRGDITFDTTELGDFVIARSITDPLYHFVVVVDDALMGVTHVIRGEDHVSNTPRQILIMEALGYTQPVYVHLPLILASDRSKLSKRKGAVSVTEYRAQGYTKEAINNYLALLGWNPGTDDEIFTMEELVEAFSLEGIQKGGAIFDVEKLKWIQREHKKLLPEDELLRALKDGLRAYPALVEVLERSKKATEDILERFVLISDLHEAIEAGEYDFYITQPVVTKEGLTWKKDKNPNTVHERLETLTSLLEKLDANTFTYEAVKDAVWEYAEAEGKGDVLWPMRYALSGKERSPDPFVLAEALGKDETLARLKLAYDVCI